MNIASIDIGSNSVILLIAEIDKNKRTFIPLMNFYTTPRIGKNLSSEGIITLPSFTRLKEALEGFNENLKGFDTSMIFAVGTEALRKAKNSQYIVDEIKKEMGIEIRILSGEEEGKLTFLGATSIFDDFTGYVIDIGGGSTEIIYGNNSEIISTQSYKFGAVNLFETLNVEQPIEPDKISEIKKYIRTKLIDLLPHKGDGCKAIAVAGTPTTLACIDVGINEFDENKIEGYQLSILKIYKLTELLAGKSSSEILSEYGNIVEGREDVILTGTIILETIMEMLELDDIYVSTRGLRHGVILNHINQ